MSMRYPAGFIRPGYDPLKNPDAPTIGTATGGDASASVAFTAPSDTGGSAVSAYYAVSNPGGITASGATSPVSVTGLTNGTPYTFTVWALNTYGPGPYSAASGSVTPVNPYYIATLIPTSGPYYISGYMFTAVNADGMFVAGGDDGGRLQKINFDGTIGFQKVITVSGGYPYFTAACVDSSANVYTGGRVTTGSGSGPWITKYNSSGSVTWSRGIGYLAYDTASITTDSSQNVYYTGRKNTTFFDGSNRIVVGSLNSSGANRWQTEYGTGTSGFVPGGVGVYGSNVFVAGTWHQSGTYTRYGVLFTLAQSNGSLGFEQSYVGGSYFYTLVTDAVTGMSYIGGQSNNSRSLILKVNSSGVKQWGMQLATGNTTCRVAIDGSGNVYAISGGDQNSDDRTIAISKYNSSGTIQWQRNLRLSSGQSVSYAAMSVSVTSSGNIFISSFVIDTGPTFYAFTALLNPDGSGTGTYTFGGKTYTYSASSYTSATDTNTFTGSSNGVTAESRSVSTITTSSATDNLTLAKTSL